MIHREELNPEQKRERDAAWELLGCLNRHNFSETAADYNGDSHK